MFDSCSLTADEIKRILMLYGNLQRLEVLNKKIQNNTMNTIKKRISAINLIEDDKKRNTEREECLLEIINRWDETRENISLYNATVYNILTAYEKIMLSDIEKNQCKEQTDGME